MDVVIKELYDAGFAVKIYNIAEDRSTFKFRDEMFDFNGEQAKQTREFVIAVCPVDVLREIAKEEK